MASDEDILNRLNVIFRDVLNDEDINLSPATTAADIQEWHSLNHVRLMVSAEREFKVKFTAAELSRLKNVGDLVGLLKGRGV
jgi:acyl carrier protein